LPANQAGNQFFLVTFTTPWSNTRYKNEQESGYGEIRYLEIAIRPIHDAAS
jgi:hypothetical protein